MADSQRAIMESLGKVFKAEMAGVVRYTHYSFMIMGYNRIPIQKWFRDQAQESLTHAVEVGEKITSYGGHPPVISAPVEETNIHTIKQILTESLTFEEEGIRLYGDLIKIAHETGDIALEEMARQLYREEQDHVDEVKKMLRNPDTK